MAASAIALCLVYVAAVFGAQTLLQRRRSGSSGWIRSLGSNAAERAANVMYLLSCVLDLGGPLLVITGVLHPLAIVDLTAAHLVGFGLFAVAAPIALLAQHAMGDSWRTGIDATCRTPLVTRGPFAVVRNPVYTTMLGTSLAVALLVPTVISPIALVGCLAAIEVQTRFVEEPFLRLSHGERYREYSARVGRFLPSLGRLRAPYRVRGGPV